MLVELHTRLLVPGLDVRTRLSLVGLAMGGTFVIYGLDRLRDVESDSRAWPDRTAFVARNRRALWVAVAAMASVGAACAALQPPKVLAICAGVGVMGLAHRRLKSKAGFKIAYLTLAWWMVVVGLPAAHAAAAPIPGSARVFWAVSAASGLALLSNLVGSNGFDEARAGLRHPAIALGGAGVIAALVGGVGVTPLACVPAAQALALWPAHASERARLWRIDGALALGAGIALGWLEAIS